MTVNVTKSTNMLQMLLYSIVRLGGIILYLIIFIIPTNIITADVPTIVLASDYRCPYSCDPQDQKPGYLVEVAKKIFEIYGIKVEYKIMPWSDALKAAEEGTIDGVIGINDIGGRDLVIPKIPQGYTITSVFSRNGTNWVYDGPESLVGKKIVIVLDYEIKNNAVQQYITTNYLRDPWSFTVESGVNAVTDSVDGVIDKTADIYIGCQTVVTHYLNSHNLNEHIKNCGEIDNSEPLYIAFSGNSSKTAKYIKMLEDGMVSIEAIGDITNLKNKYQITP